MLNLFRSITWEGGKRNVITKPQEICMEVGRWEIKTRIRLLKMNLLIKEYHQTERLTRLTRLTSKKQRMSDGSSLKGHTSFLWHTINWSDSAWLRDVKAATIYPRHVVWVKFKLTLSCWYLFVLISYVHNLRFDSGGAVVVSNCKIGEGKAGGPDWGILCPDVIGGGNWRFALLGSSGFGMKPICCRFSSTSLDCFGPSPPGLLLP